MNANFFYSYSSEFNSEFHFIIVIQYSILFISLSIIASDMEFEIFVIYKKYHAAQPN